MNEEGKEGRREAERTGEGGPKEADEGAAERASSSRQACLI